MSPELRQISQTHGTPCYVYFAREIARLVALLQSAFASRMAISYAVKCNPNMDVLRFMAKQVPFLDISSLGEMKIALQSGWDAQKMSFTGPAKTPAVLENAVLAGVGEIVLESLREAADLATVCKRLGKIQPVLVRVAPSSMPKGFGDWMAGKPSQFGIDEEVAPDTVARIAALPGLSLNGFHIYSGTQCLNAESISANYANFVRIFRQLAPLARPPIRKLIFGSGLGVTYHEKDRPVDLSRVAAETNPMLDGLRQEEAFRDAEFVLETGRYLVAAAGVFLTRVVHQKESRGTTICVCDGGMNHNQMATGRFGMVIPRNYVMANVTNPDGPVRKYHIAGPLCTTLDLIGRDVLLPEVGIGDTLAIFNSGAYGPTASPLGFISFDPPQEILI